jgi:hypothetical protein
MNKIEQLQHEFKLFSKDLLLPTTTLDSYRKSQGFTCEYINPTVIEERKLNVTQIDVFSRLMMDRIIFLGTAIDDTVGNIITAQLLFMQSQNPDETIQLYINSPGGSVSDGLTIYDTMIDSRCQAILPNLPGECFHILELDFFSDLLQKLQPDLFAIDVFIKVKDMSFHVFQLFSLFDCGF